MFFFRQLVDAYGCSYLGKLISQRPTFVRGTAASATAIYTGPKLATFGTFGPLIAAPGATAQFTLPRHSPFVSWAQGAAILAGAKHKAAAQLYLSWLLSEGFPAHSGTWSPRTDIPAPAGRQSIFAYPNTDPTGLGRFLADRGAVDRFRARVQLYVGDVKGPSPTGRLGFYPGGF